MLIINELAVKVGESWNCICFEAHRHDCGFALGANICLLACDVSVMPNAGKLNGLATALIHIFFDLALFGDAGVVAMASDGGQLINSNHDVFPLATVWFYMVVVSINSTLNVVCDFMRHSGFNEIISIVFSNVELKHKLALAVITMTTTGAIALEDYSLRTLKASLEELFSDQKALFNFSDDLLANVALHVASVA